MRMRKFARDEEGAIMVLVALFLTVLLGFTALTVDMGIKYLHEAQIQNACDAAALAAAASLPDTTAATEVAKYYMEKNGYEGSKAIIEFEAEDTEIEVSYEYDVETSFAKVLGVDSQKVICSAKAGCLPGTPTGGKPGGVFDFLLFQGSENTMTLTAGAGVYGDIHCNGNISVQSIKCLGGISQTGDKLEATSAFKVVSQDADDSEQFDEVGSIRINWSTYPVSLVYADDPNLYSYLPSSETTNIKDTSLYTKEEDPIDMPMYLMDNLNEIIPDSIPSPKNYSKHYTSAEAITSGTHTGSVYAASSLSYSTDGANIVINGDVYCDGDLSLRAYGGTITVNGNLYVKGNIKLDTGFGVTINGNIYCEGDISNSGSGFTLDCDYTYCKNFIPGGAVKASGAIVAENNITFTSSDNGIESGAVAIVSKNGNIDMTAGSQSINGIVFAPEGTISLGGSSRVTGNLIGKDLNVYSDLDIRPMSQKTQEELGDIIIDKNDTPTKSNGGVKLLK